MYPVSNMYNNMIRMDDRVTRITGTITLTDGSIINIGSDDIAILPCINNQCSGNDELILGQVYQGQLEFGIYSDIDRYKIYGARVELSFGLLLNEHNDIWEDVPLGKYKVSDCIRQSTDQLKITALDDIDKLNKKHDSTVLSGTPYTILTYISLVTDLELGQTEEELEALPNGDKIFGIDGSSNISSYRDIVGDLAACMCGFAVIGRDGKLYIRTFKTVPDASFSEDDRGNDTISDYEVVYSGVHVTKQGEDIYVGEDTDQILDLKDNAFLQFGLDETTEEVLQSILDVISAVNFPPATLTIKYSDPAFDLGDLIESYGYTSGDSILVPIHKLTWRWRAELKIEAVGKNPFLNPTSKTDKEIESMKSQVEAKSMTYYVARNIAEINLNDRVPQTIIDIRFAAKENTAVEIWHEFKIYSEKSCENEKVKVYHDEEIPDDPETEEDENETVTTEIGYFEEKKVPVKAVVRYYYDEVQVSYHPIETWMEDGYHILSLHWFIDDIDNITTHTWRVTLELQDGSGSIAINDAMANLHGQSLVASEEQWDGTIEIREFVGVCEIADLSNRNINDVNIVLDISTPLVPEDQVKDEVHSPGLNHLSSAAIEDKETSVILSNVVFGIITDDGDYILTEDEQYYLCTDDNTSE